MENTESVSSPTASVENSDAPKKAGLFANPATAKGLVLVIAGSIALLRTAGHNPNRRIGMCACTRYLGTDGGVGGDSSLA